MKSAFVATLTALVADQALAACTASPTTVSNFDASAFAGIWHMQASTFYANDEEGCFTLSISDPNSSNKLDAALRKIELWSWNPLKSGMSVQNWSFDYNSSGSLTTKTLGVISSDKYKVLDTDNTSYAVVYECTKDPYHILNYSNDNVHIFTRSETVTDANLTTYKTTAETKMGISGFASGFETLISSKCLSSSYIGKITEAFSNPDQFWRKW